MIIILPYYITKPYDNDSNYYNSGLYFGYQNAGDVPLMSIGCFRYYHKALTDFRKNNTFLFEITKEEQKINELISKGDCYNTICNCNNNSVTNDNTFIIKN